MTNKRTIITFDRLDSTSDHLKAHSAVYPDLAVVRTLDQTRGHGQHGRVWISEPHRNVLFSVLVKRVTFGTMSSLMDVVRDVMLGFYRSRGIEATFENPNDIMAKGLKLTGILIESKSANDAFTDVVIGIGMNVNQVDFGDLPATSMRLLTGKIHDCDEVFEDIIRRLLDVLDQTIEG